MTKLATFEAGLGPEVGIVTDEGMLPLSRLRPALASSMVQAIEQWNCLKLELPRLTAQSHALNMSELRLLAPIARPGKLLAIGLNYKDHIQESGLPTPAHQLWFSKQPTSVNPPFDAIEIPLVSHTVDYEAELVVVIGAKGRHISKERAEQYIFGYCCGNDVSVREWQRFTPQWMLGKSFDTHAPFGPWIVTADEVGDPHVLDIRCAVNGETRQQSNTRQLLFDVFAQIEHLSMAMTLEPGDLIFTGTPGGVGAAMKPPRYLRAGDRVRVEIERLGAIEASLVDEARPEC
jgi:ureidoglycolate lyase